MTHQISRAASQAADPREALVGGPFRWGLPDGGVNEGCATADVASGGSFACLMGEQMDRSDRQTRTERERATLMEAVERRASIGHAQGDRMGAGNPRRKVQRRIGKRFAAGRRGCDFERAGRAGRHLFPVCIDLNLPTPGARCRRPRLLPGRRWPRSGSRLASGACPGSDP